MMLIGVKIVLVYFAYSREMFSECTSLRVLLISKPGHGQVPVSRQVGQGQVIGMGAVHP